MKMRCPKCGKFMRLEKKVQDHDFDEWETVEWEVYDCRCGNSESIQVSWGKPRHEW